MDLIGKSIFILKYNSEYDSELIIVFANILSTLQNKKGICMILTYGTFINDGQYSTHLQLIVDLLCFSSLISNFSLFFGFQPGLWQDSSLSNQNSRESFLCVALVPDNPWGYLLVDQDLSHDATSKLKENVIHIVYCPGSSSIPSNIWPK